MAKGPFKMKSSPNKFLGGILGGNKGGGGGIGLQQILDPIGIFGGGGLFGRGKEDEGVDSGGGEDVNIKITVNGKSVGTADEEVVDEAPIEQAPLTFKIQRDIRRRKINGRRIR
jgi:hypothetical protein